ncbi:MAG: LysM peptidoglycan-binding domain-containing protein, partial [Bacteroidales bacterium]|nr:LysM peptidoglycan-binding domain-containing protein [Bacteroidales bacterium]
MLKFKTILFIFLLQLGFKIGFTQSAEIQLNKMLEQIEALNSIEFKIVLEERIEGEIYIGISKVKCTYNPYKLYYYQISPNEGLEILLNEEIYGDKAIINPNSFPYVNMYLSPHHTLMRKNKHHTIIEGSVFKYMGNILNNLITNHTKEIQILDSGLVKINNVLCHKVIIEINNFKVLTYNVKENEDIYSISQKNYIDDYMILMLNNEINNYYDIRPGQVIKIPNHYCKEIHLYIDQSNFIPILIKIFDDKGLYEKYYFSELKIN